MIILKNVNISKGNTKDFDKLDIGEQFAYVCGYEVIFPLGWKLTEKHAVFVNARGRFILARRYDNLLSIGSTSVEYRTFDEAKQRLEENPDWIETR